MNKLHIVVPGWPSIELPGRMAFFFEQVKSISEKNPKAEIYVYIIQRCVFGRKWDEFQYLDVDNRVKISIFRYYAIPKSKYINRFLFDFHGKKLVNKINENGLGEGNNIVHVHFLDSLVMVSSLSNDYRVIWTEHASNLNLYLEKHGVEKVNQAVENVDFCLCVSESLKKQVLKSIVISKKLVSVIPNGVRTKVKKYKKSNFSPRDFVFVGHLNKRKGIFNAIKSLTYKGIEDVTLTIYGSGELELKIRTYIVENNLQSRVFMKGQVSNDQIRDEMYKYDCLILPSESESFGVVVIEAMAAGLPSLVTRCGGPEHILGEDRSLGIVIAGNDPKLISSSISDMCVLEFDPEYIRKHAIINYSWDEIAERISEKYSA